ncbi:hypothetical protein [Embleya scabrispora]|uniref:hypothetical protein n=1 Tax=Embleya scabrispora TaxID=159449 RepID=UPI00037F8011
MTPGGRVVVGVGHDRVRVGRLSCETRAWLAEATGLGTTVVHVTHDLASARLADHCLLLHGGRLVAEGVPETVLTGATLRRVWGLPDSL